jgi:cobalt-zinc-cadmium efflux system outer membrane protein
VLLSSSPSSPAPLTPAFSWTLALVLCAATWSAPGSLPPAYAQAAATAPPAGQPAAASSAAGPALALDEVLRLAREHNASLVALRLGQDVAKADIAVAAQRPNPDLAFEEARETPHESITLALPLETAGKRKRRVATATAASAVTAAGVAVAEADVRAAARRAFFTLLAADARVAISQELRDLSRRALDAAETRVREGAAPRLDILQAQLALARVENDRNAADAERQTARVELNTLLGRPPSSPLTLAGDLRDAATLPPASMPLPPAPDAAQRQATAPLPETSTPLAPAAAAAAQPATTPPLATSPGTEPAGAANVDIQLADRQLDQARTRIALAKALQVPDVTVQGAMTYRSPPDFTAGWRAGFSATIPLFTRHRADVLREEYATKQAQADREAVQQSATGAIAAARSQAAALQAQAERNVREILPRMREVEALAEESYRAGQTNLAALLQAFQTARDVRIQALQTALAFQLALADLERAEGTTLP